MVTLFTLRSIESTNSKCCPALPEAWAPADAGAHAELLYNIIIHSSCEMKGLVEIHLCDIGCDTPIARIDHKCRGLLYARC